MSPLPPNTETLLAFDRAHVLHPYASMLEPPPVLLVASASGVELSLADGRVLVDGTSSWWSAIHGYSHPVLQRAMAAQIETMSHVMFGGLTHAPAISLSRRLLACCPPGLDKVFFSDSGSVAVEVALKMALACWQGLGRPGKTRLLSLRQGYHGDTFATMAVSDPDSGMQTVFGQPLQPPLFAPAPACRFGEPWEAADSEPLRQLLATRHEEIAALIMEPIMQGAGGMRFHHPEYLREAQRLCAQFDVLLILDEIATGFGRTGRLFASDHAGITPDILCLGKALTGGCMTLAATLCTRRVAEGVSGAGEAFMHGPTYMANPLACAVADASLQLLLEGPWEARVAAIERQLRAELTPCRSLPAVADVRVLGAVGVVELREHAPLPQLQNALVQEGVWVRPFGKLVYLMPPYIISAAQLRQLTAAVVKVVEALG